MILLATALLASLQDGRCPPDIAWPETFDMDSEVPLERAGPGLWIAGVPFPAEEIESATASVDPLLSQWGIEIHFTPAGAAKFAWITRCRLMRMTEVSFDRRALSRPMVNEEIRGGQARISGSFTPESAMALAAKLKPAQP